MRTTPTSSLTGGPKSWEEGGNWVMVMGLGEGWGNFFILDDGNEVGKRLVRGLQEMGLWDRREYSALASVFLFFFFSYLISFNRCLFGCMENRV